MKHKLIALLLLSHTLSAYAAGGEPLAAVQNNDPEHAEWMLAEADEVAPDGELAAAGLQDAPDASAHKAIDDFISVMPQLGHSGIAAKQKDETATDTRQNDNLGAAVKKFASMSRMRSAIVLIYDENGKQTLHSKNADVVTPIASITKLMTAMVVLDAKLPLDEEISISSADINRQKRSRSRTHAGMTMTRGEMLKLALMASDNLSAAALARTYPGGTEAALAQMNAKARELGMNSARFMDPTGLHSGNVATANDLVKMVRAAREYELIHQFTTSTSHTIEQAGRRPLRFHNTNPLVRNASWDIGLSKTGYINEAGRCLVMEAKISEHPVIIVLLDSWGRNSRVGDANRVKQWMEKAVLHPRNL
jgi:D-alanyl-D-alanine endopeptidase (penicillin-binding protein 7)